MKKLCLSIACCVSLFTVRSQAQEIADLNGKTSGEANTLILCAAYHDKRSDMLSAELDRRHALTEIDRKSIQSNQIDTKISECGLFALWGFPLKVLLNYQDLRHDISLHQKVFLYKPKDALLFVFLDHGVVSGIQAELE